MATTGLSKLVSLSFSASLDMVDPNLEAVCKLNDWIQGNIQQKLNAISSSMESHGIQGHSDLSLLKTLSLIMSGL